MNQENREPAVSEREAIEWLRAQHSAPSPIALHEVKRRARAQAMRSMHRSPAPRSRLATFLSAGVLAGSMSIGFALAGNGPPSSPSAATSSGSAASSVYKPGKGCGDKNHVHEREAECKKPPR